MDRREVLMALSAMLGSSAMLSACGGKGPEEVADTVATDVAGGDALQFYSQRQFDLLKRLSDTIIPTTDTPGALEADIPEFMDGMLATWASADTQASHQDNWTVLDAALTALIGSDPLDADQETFFNAVDTLDAAAFGGPKLEIDVEAGNPTSAYKAQKSFVAMAYYHSEPGATIELQYELNPVEIIRCAPLEEVGRTWAL